MAVPKFSNGRHFKRAQQHYHHSTKGNNNNKAITTANSLHDLLSSDHRHIISALISNNNMNMQQVTVTKKTQQTQTQTQELTIEQQREKLLRHAKRRIGRGLIEEYDGDESQRQRHSHSHSHSQQTFMERQDSNSQLRNISVSKLEIGEILGMGAFAQVRVIKSFKNEQNEKRTTTLR
jgi:hypothetical protein